MLNFVFNLKESDKINKIARLADLKQFFAPKSKYIYAVAYSLVNWYWLRKFKSGI